MNICSICAGAHVTSACPYTHTHPMACVCSNCCDRRLAAINAASARARAWRLMREKDFFDSRAAKKRNQVIRGLRVWNCDYATKELYSIGITGHKWSAGTVESARCNPSTKHPSHSAPNERCHCGIWAIMLKKRRAEKIVWDYIRAIQNSRPLVPSLAGLATPLTVPVLGVVKMWGKVIKHSYGYRAEFAYPERLWTFGPEGEMLAINLSEIWGIPVEKFTQEGFKKR